MIGGWSLTGWWPLRVLLLVAAVAAAVALVAAGRRWWIRALLVPVLAGAVGVNVLVGVNAYFGYYGTVGQALGWPGQGSDSATVTADQPTAPAHGMVVSVTIPGPVSRFVARPAEVYLPPAWFLRRHPPLPVLLLLHGTPGSPSDWTDAGMAAATLDTWADAHSGYAPVVVMPDINGSMNGDTECVDSRLGNAETYLTTDVTDFVHIRYDTAPTGRAWAVAGLSEGGSCSIMLALRHPQMFPTFADYSGLAGPRVGDTNDPAGTAAALFGGSRTAFDQHEPAWLLTHQHYPGVAGWFEVGGDDAAPLAAARELAPLAQRAGITTRTVVVPGESHTFALWRAAFADSLPWLVHRLGALPPPVAPTSVRAAAAGAPSSGPPGSASAAPSSGARPSEAPDGASEPAALFEDSRRR